MYDNPWGLTDRPFQLTPDPRFWFETATHRKAMAYLGYGLAQGEGFIVITGEIGAGKTTLVGHLLDTLDRQRVTPVHIVSTAVQADDLLRIVADQLGIAVAGIDKAQLLIAIERGLHAVARTGRRTLLVVDEAQALPVSALEELRMLSNFQAGGHALLQILLLGQPEFRDRLNGSDRLEQLRQRIIAIHHLDPMEESEVADYVAHRLGMVGWTGRPDFAADAFDALYEGSGGVPRRLNLLAGRVMLYAAIEGVTLIDGATVRGVMQDLHADLPIAMPEPRAAAPAPVATPVPAPQPVRVTAAASQPEPQWLPVSDPVEADRGWSVAAAAEPVSRLPEGTEPVSPVAVPAASPALPAASPVVPADEARGPVTTTFTLDAASHRDADLVSASAPEPEVVEPEPTPAEPVVAPAFRHDETQAAEAKPVDTTDNAPQAAPIPESVVAADAAPQPDPVLLDHADRIAALELRIEEQDAALRRVLTLLVDWVEADEARVAAAAAVPVPQSPPAPASAPAAAAAAAAFSPVPRPIHGPAAWNDAA